MRNLDIKLQNYPLIYRSKLTIITMSQIMKSNATRPTKPKIARATQSKGASAVFAIANCTSFAKSDTLNVIVVSPH